MIIKITNRYMAITIKKMLTNAFKKVMFEECNEKVEKQLTDTINKYFNKFKKKYKLAVLDFKLYNSQKFSGEVELQIKLNYAPIIMNFSLETNSVTIPNIRKNQLLRKAV